MSAKERVWLFGFFGYLENVVAVIFMKKKKNSIYYQFASVPLLSVAWLRK